MLDAEIVPGGTYRIEGAHAVRRSIRHMAHEFASGQLLHGGGHDRHHCPEVRPDWLNR
jgi:hypothetical protein